MTNVTLHIREKQSAPSPYGRIFTAWIDGDFGVADMFPLGGSALTSSQVIRYKNAVEDKVWKWQQLGKEINFSYGPELLQ